MRENCRDAIERVDGRVAELIFTAALAGAYGEAIRLMPETAGGFGRLLRKHSARVAALAAEISADVRRAGATSRGV